MPPKKKGQKMDLASFMADTATGGSWADEMDALPSGPSGERTGGGSDQLGGSHLSRNARGGPDGGRGGDFGDRPMRAEVPFPTAPPYTAYVGNLSFETAEPDLEDFFGGLGVTSVRMVMGQDGRPKGFGYVEFEAADGLRSALDRTGADLQGRTIRVGVAEAPSSREGRADAVSSWERSGPLAPLPGRSGGFGGGGGFQRAGGGGFDAPEVEREGPLRGGKFVPSAPAPDRSGGFGGARSFSGASGAPGGPREFQRAPEVEVERDAPLRGGKFVPSAPVEPRRPSGFGMGPPGGGPGGERRVSEQPSRADEGNWERKGPPPAQPGRQTSFGSRGGGGGFERAPEPATRRPLNLAPRASAPSSEGSSPAGSPAPTPSSKASPFGAARAVDNSARDKEIEDKITKQRQEAAEAAAKAKAAAPPKAKSWTKAAPVKGAEAKEEKVEAATAQKDAPPHVADVTESLGEVTI